MKFAIDIDSTQVRGNTREEVMQKISEGFRQIDPDQNGGSISGLGNYFLGNGVFRFYRLYKFNKKSKQTQKVVNGKNVSTCEVIRKPYWVGEYITVNKDIISEAVQKNRSFDIKFSVPN